MEAAVARKIRCKRIIDGQTYNTETATLVAGYDDDYDGHPVGSGAYLFQTRFGAFFVYEDRWGFSDDDYEIIKPLSPAEAQTWLEQRHPTEPELIERYFGEMPEAGADEVKFTLRMPQSLRNQLAEIAKGNKQSLNAWAVRCLESCAKQAQSARKSR